MLGECVIVLYDQENKLQIVLKLNFLVILDYTFWSVSQLYLSSKFSLLVNLKDSLVLIFN